MLIQVSKKKVITRKDVSYEREKVSRCERFQCDLEKNKSMPSSTIGFYRYNQQPNQAVFLYD